MKSEDIKKVEPLLKALLHNSLSDSVDFVVAECSQLGNSPQEPDFIASLVLNFTPQLFTILKNVFPERKFSVTGVFCHQKPLVDIGLTKDPELGDILLVYVYRDDGGYKKFNSLLFQAKISTKSTVLVSSADEHQLKLYSEWPVFKYKRAGKLNGITRDILPKTIHDGAQYLLIESRPVFWFSDHSGSYPMGCAIPAKTLSINNSFTIELIDFLKFKSGRAFEENPFTTDDDWTKLVWDILKVTKDKVSKRRNSRLMQFPRQVTSNLDGYCFFINETTSIFQDIHEELAYGDFLNKSDDFFDEENISPSVILIECSEREGEG